MLCMERATAELLGATRLNTDPTGIASCEWAAEATCLRLHLNAPLAADPTGTTGSWWA